MIRVLLLSAGLLLLVGCGSSQVAQPEPVKEEASAAESPTAGELQQDAKSASVPQPTDVVGQFLDTLRRGDAEAPIEELLTEQAREACRIQGLRIQPLGTAEATFEVTRGQMVPGQEDACLVHCLWNEPDATTGQSASYQLVWALRKEAPGWRISGVIAQMGEEEEPLIIDFEDPNALAAHFGPRKAAAVAEVPGTVK